MDISIGQASGAFQLAVAQLRAAECRDELEVTQIPATPNMANEAVAFAGDVVGAQDSAHTDNGTGRLVLMHDRDQNEAWGGDFRVVAFTKSPLETYIGADEEISEVAWAWLSEALANRGAEYINPAGTITRVISTGFGSLAGKMGHAELEMRVSWTPTSHFGAHFEAWQDLLCMMSGFPLLPNSVSALHGRASAGRSGATGQVISLR